MVTSLALSILLVGSAPQAANTLSAAERSAGWKLLFDGKSTAGWKNFKSDKVGDGWVVENGVLKITNPGTAGDIVTEEKFDWFELVLDFNLGQGQNSGVMYHVGEEGGATWHTGPEIQLYDHPFQPGVQVTGFLYELYESKVDASKPAGQWNTMRIVVNKDKCYTEVNGVRYYEYVLGSPEFNERVAKSKFSRYRNFAKLGKGSIAIQGDHGLVSFRNIKIRPIKN